MDERASDAERELASERLSAATAEGRIGVDELEQRLELVQAARTRAELEATASDLPQISSAAVRRDRVQTSGGSEVLDLTDLSPGETCELEVDCRAGAVGVRVPSGTRVILDGVNRGGATAIRVRPQRGGAVVRLHQQNAGGSIHVYAPEDGLFARLRRTFNSG